MTGPALKDPTAHSSIHHAVRKEIEEVVENLERRLKQGPDIRRDVIEQLMGIWENKVLTHAQEEENGLYAEVLKKSPVFSEKLIKLSRDHELMRLLIEKIRSLPVSVENGRKFLEMKRALLLILEVHTREEEEILAKTY